MVNPHASLLLGYPDLETPAEIDGLLDDYFNRSSHSIVMPYNDETGEMSDSQLSLPTSNGSAGRRILYDNALNARRNIMGLASAPALPTTSSQQTVYHRPGDRSPLTRLPSESHAWPPQASMQDPRNAGVALHPMLQDTLYEDAVSESAQRIRQQPTPYDQYYSQARPEPGRFYEQDDLGKH